MRLLLVEDEQKLAKTIKEGLGRQGYAIDHVDDGQKAKNRIQVSHQDYDIIILDLELPHKGGLEICREIRSLNITTPVLVLTGDKSIESKVALFDAGADDYLVKPFIFDELFSRIRAVTRRPQNLLPSELKIGDITLNPATQKVFRGENEIKLTLKEFRILEYFMRNPDVVLSREDITSNIWDFDYDSFSNVLDVFISKIRSKIDKDRGQNLIETVQGIGYRISSRQF